MKIIKKIGIISVLLVVFITSLGLSIPVSAAVSTEISNKALVGDLKKCYESGALKSSINIQDFAFGSNDGTTIMNSSSEEVNVPNEGGFNSSSYVFSCKELITKKLGLGSVGLNGSTSAKADILKKLGYTPGANTTNEQCLTIKMKRVTQDGKDISTESPFDSNIVCLQINSDDGKIASDYVRVTAASNKGVITFTTNPLTIIINDDRYDQLNGVDNRKTIEITPNRSTWSGITKSIESFISEFGRISLGYDQEGGTIWYQYAGSDTNAEGSGEASNWILNQSTAWSKVLGSGIYTLTTEEKRQLYEYYLSAYGDFSCEADSTRKEISFTINGEKATMFAKRKSEFTDNKLFVPDGSNAWTGSDSATFDEVLDYMNNKTINGGFIQSCEDSGGNPTNDPSKPSGSTKDSSGLDLAECFNGADALGWILCPVIKIIHAAIETIYEEIIEPFLTVNVSAFATDSGTFQGWQIFQGFANIIFVILFLIVIFSQITGIGIDNYGIKRILPKLIVTAILINISFLICQLLVDVSNILGVGLKNLFSSIQIEGATVSTGQQALTTAVSGMIAGMGGAAAAATAEMWLPALIVPLLIGLISILISVIFMFILLGIRQAGVIILVVISPVAFVLYMLPNTKPLFDKWKKMFEGLLMLFPICGAMIGGCALAGEILKSTSDGFWVSLLAALLTVVPFFFVPKLLKGSFAAMGNIGGKISALGAGLSKRASGAVANSQGVKDATTRMAAGVNAKGETTALGRMRDKIASGKSIYSKIPGMQRAASRSAARGRAAYYKDQADQRREAQLNDPSYRAAYEARQAAEFLNDRVSTEQALIEANSDFIGGDYDKVASDMVGWMKEGGEDNAVKVRAAMNALNKIGDDGRTAIDNALSADGGLDFTSMPLETRQAFASQAMNNFAGEWKNNARSLFEAAKANTGAKGTGRYSDFVPGGSNAAKVSSYRQEQFANMDDGQFAHIMSDVQALQAKQTAGTISSDETARLEAWQQLAYDTMNNENLAGSMKGQRGANIRTIASGYKAPAPSGDAKEGQSFQVNNSSKAPTGNTTNNFVDTMEMYNQVAKNVQSRNRSTEERAPSESAFDQYYNDDNYERGSGNGSRGRR